MKTLVCDRSVEAVESEITFQRRNIFVFLFVLHEAHSLMLTWGQWIPLILSRRVRKQSEKGAVQYSGGDTETEAVRVIC